MQQTITRAAACIAAVRAFRATCVVERQARARERRGASRPRRRRITTGKGRS